MKRLDVIMRKDRRPGPDPVKIGDVDGGGFTHDGVSRAQLGPTGTHELFTLIGKGAMELEFHLVDRDQAEMLVGCRIVQHSAGCVISFIGGVQPVPT